tara:strand:- start:3794 stop:4273 length:480 start_codon:yes stop_codon:yes gene_type:complete
MKPLKKQLLLASIILLGLTTNAQDYLMKLGYASANVELAENFKEYKSVPTLYNQNFTYKYKGEEVLVSFKENEHVEYYSNKEHYIKSTVIWLNKNECLITLTESTLPNFPFKPGNSLKMKITEIKGKYVYYESTLGGRTWEGKMKQTDVVEEDLFASTK